ncbi:HAD family hydrolase [Deinococcus yunweiensis]|uniref:HAD family hydrolase n=1 Tax=Deinococcus yunweiensis TaxID=367282 RepID=UPI00398EAF1E
MTALPALRAVLFDRDDTIAYTDRSVYRDAATWGAAHFGLEAAQIGRTLAALWQESTATDHELSWWTLRSLEDEQVFWETYGRELERRLNLPAGAGAEFVARFPYEVYIRAVPGAREVLTALRARGLKLGVLSNTLRSIDRTLDAVGLGDLIDVAVASCTVGAHKPDPAGYLHAAQALGVQLAEVLFIDDKPENVEAARRLGMAAEVIDLTGQLPGALHSLDDVLALVETRTASA